MLNDPATQKTISTAAYGTSGLTTAGGIITTNELAIIVGIAFTIGTFIINLAFQSKRNKREIERHVSEEKRKDEMHCLQTKIAKAKLEQLHQKQ